jgi:hypothetical protein
MDTSNKIARCVMLAEAMSTDSDLVEFVIDTKFDLSTSSRKKYRRATVTANDEVIASATGDSIEEAIGALDTALTELAKKRAEAILGVVG